MSKLDIEYEFDTLIPSIGGIRVDSIVGKSPNFDNADYLFDADKIILELKCLQDNKLQDVELNKKIFKHFRKWRKQGLDIQLSYDGWRGTISNLPRECSNEILKIYSKSIKRRVLKANKQIKETKNHLNKSDYKGILLLVNDGNFSLDPEHIYHILNSILRNSYSAINATIFLTANYPCKAQFTNVDTNVWANLNRKNMPPINITFFKKLQNGWFKHMEQLIGSSVPTIQLRNEQDLRMLVNANKQI